jgi:hypothetical protein
MLEQHHHVNRLKPPQSPELYLRLQLLLRTHKHPIKRLLIFLGQCLLKRHPPSPLLRDHLTEGHRPRAHGAISARTGTPKRKSSPQYINGMLIVAIRTARLGFSL